MPSNHIGPEADISPELIRDLHILGDLDRDTRNRLAEALNAIPENTAPEPVATAIQTMIRLIGELGSLPSMRAETGASAREPWRDAYEREQAAFDQLLPSLLKTRPGKYVAITGGQIVDEDDDEIALAVRTEGLHRKQFVLIHRVAAEEEVEDMPSIESEY